MHISWPISFVLISILILFLGKRRLAYSALSFFSPFTATSAINIAGETDSGSGISVSWLILIAFIIYFLAKQVKNLSEFKCYIFVYKKIYFIIFFYWFFCLLSLFILYFNYREYFIYNEFIFKCPGFDKSNLARFLFFSVGLFFSVQFSKKASLKDVVAVLDGFIWGATAACILGLFDYLTNLNIAANLFNTNISKFAQGYTAEGKITGPAVEPSLLVQVVGVSLAISLAKISSNQVSSIFQQKKLLTSIIVQFVTVALSGAHTSIPVLVALVIQTLFIFKGLFYKFFVASLSLLILSQYVSTLSDKLSSFSGFERVGSVLEAYSFYLKSPIFGYGFSEVTSHDFFINSLVNTGTVATVLLLIVIGKVTFSALNLKNSSYAKKAGLWCFLNLVVVMSFSGFSHPFVHFYITLALAVWSLITKEKDIDTARAHSSGTFYKY